VAAIMMQRLQCATFAKVCASFSLIYCRLRFCTFAGPMALMLWLDWVT
jgi:hypothetical protein